jgi:hypothetical protein
MALAVSGLVASTRLGIAAPELARATSFSASGDGLYERHQELANLHLEIWDGVEAIFREWGVADIDALERLAKEMPSDAADMRRLADESERLDERMIEEHGYPYETTLEQEDIDRRLEALEVKWGHVTADDMPVLVRELERDFRDARDLVKQAADIEAERMDVQRRMEFDD